MFVVKCALVLCAAVAATSGYNLGAQDVVFHLFTRSNPTQSEPLLSNVASIMTSSMSLARKTVITIHSFGDSANGNFNAFVVPTEMQADDVNLIAVDWSVGCKRYTNGLANAPQTGEIIAGFINILLQDFAYDPEFIRIVGVGLGGHIAGIAARKSAGVIPHIIALNPSLIGWTHHPDKLNADDADVVEVLHTTSGITGYDLPLGDLDFYANGGTYQNGCGTDESCSHIYSYAFYAESITSELLGGARFVGTQCATYQQAITLACTGSRDVIFGGSSVKTGVSGIYTFRTNVSPPFANN